MSKDIRYVYGFCTWHDSIHKAGNTGPQKININGREVNSPGLPCCPFCGSMLMEVESEKDYYESAFEYDKKHPGYLKMLQWSQGKCFLNPQELYAAYNKETGANYEPKSTL